VEFDGGCGESEIQDFFIRVWYIGRGSGGLGGGDDKVVVDLSRASTGHFVVPTCRVVSIIGGLCLSIGTRTPDCIWVVKVKKVGSISHSPPWRHTNRLEGVNLGSPSDFLNNLYLVFITKGLELFECILKANLLGDLENNGGELVLFVSTLLGALTFIVPSLFTILTRCAS